MKLSTLAPLLPYIMSELDKYGPLFTVISLVCATLILSNLHNDIAPKGFKSDTESETPYQPPFSAHTLNRMTGVLGITLVLQGIPFIGYGPAMSGFLGTVLIFVGLQIFLWSLGIKSEWLGNVEHSIRPED